MQYKAILFHPEGDYVTDFKRDSKQDVWDEISEMGSRWIFYPIALISTDKTIVDAPEGLEFLIGKRIKTAVEFFKAQWKERSTEICEAINNGTPFNFIY
jgi:hypothetical protein